MTTYASILQAAMKLSNQERVALAEALWEALDKAGDEELLEQIPESQRAAIARRSAEVAAGTAQLVTWERMVERAQGEAGGHG